MSSLSAHLLNNYDNTRPQQIVQSGAMEYDALAHGHQQGSTFSQFSQAGLAQAYRGDTSLLNSRASSSSMADLSSASLSDMSFNRGNMDLARMDRPAPLSYQEIMALQQQREEVQALKTAASIAALQAKLNQKLGPEYISQRPGPGNGPKLTYAEGWKIINLANEVFGFNGWSSSVKSLQVDFTDFNAETQRWNVGVTAIVRVELRDGTWHEDVGYGLLENCKSKGMALDKCKKESITDALKRTLRNFGNVLGNCLYDKEYTKEILKMKTPAPPKFEHSDLHRRKEFVDARPGPSNASTSTNAQQRPMAPPPPPGQPSNNSKPSAPSTSNLHHPPTTASTSSIPPKPSAPLNNAPSPSLHGAPMPKPIVRSGTDESLYAMGLDDDALFAELSFSEADVSGFDPGSSFTDRSTKIPSNGSSFNAAPLQVSPSAAVPSVITSSKAIPTPPSSKPPSTNSAQSTEEAANDRKRKIMAALMNSDPPTPSEPIASPSSKPRTSSGGGGFAIPPGVTRPQRPGQSSVNIKANPIASTSGIGIKRTSEASNMGEPGLHGFGSGSGAIGTARSALTELDNGGVKRPRLS